MAIQWFPGHMHTTRLALVQRLKSGIDVVVELLDARLPLSLIHISEPTRPY